MESAMELARESFLKDEVPVGAVVVKENIIIGRGRNTVIADNDVSSHAVSYTHLTLPTKDSV